jgi:hypothetical protein
MTEREDAAHGGRRELSVSIERAESTVDTVINGPNRRVGAPAEPKGAATANPK